MDIEPGRTAEEIDTEIDKKSTDLAENYGNICRDCGNLRSPHLWRHRFVPCRSQDEAVHEIRKTLADKICWAPMGDDRYCGVSKDEHDARAVHPFVTRQTRDRIEEIESVKAANEKATRALYDSLLR